MSSKDKDPILPPELLILVVEKLVEDGPKSPRLLSQVNLTLKQLCLTSRSLRDIAQPWLLQSIDIGDSTFAGIKLPAGQSPLPIAERLQSFFSSKPAVKAWVQHLRIRIPNRNEPNYSSAGRLGAVAEQLFLQMDRIVNLEIEHMVITPAMHKHIYSLPELQAFRCWNIFYYDDPKPFLDAPAESRIKYLTINEIHSSSSLTGEIVSLLALSPRLHSLHISATISPFIYDLVNPPNNAVFHNLSEFSTSVSQPDGLHQLWQFLAGCPNLRFLTISGRADTRTWEDLIPSPPASLVPGLKFLKAPLVIARLFGLHRSMESMIVTHGSRLRLTRDLLRSMPQNVLKLDIQHVTWDSGQSIAYLAKIFPSLTEFALLFWRKEGDIPLAFLDGNLTELIRSFSRLQKLVVHRVQAGFWSEDGLIAQEEEKELKFLKQLSVDSCASSLCEVSFRAAVTWIRDADGQWTCRKSGIVSIA